MITPMRERFSSLDRWGLAGLAVAVGFPFLGSFGLLEPDEGRFAQIGREMAANGDFLVPHLNGIEQFYKPPLVYWLNAVAYQLFGVSEWTARLPSALAFSGVIWMTGWMGWQLAGRAVGWGAALVLASMVEPYALGRQITLDMTLTFWITAALACLVQKAAGTGSRAAGFLFFLCMGLGFLAKGPMAWVVPMVAALVWTWAARKEGQRLGLPWSAGLLLMVAVSLSWFVAVSLKFHELWGYFVGYELMDRFASTTHGRSKPWWFFIPILLVGTIPWTGFLPGLAVRAWQKIRRGEFTPPQWALGAAVVVPFLVVSVSGSKLLTYILPIFPALALALAWWLNRAGGESWKKVGWGMALGLLMAWGPGLAAVQLFWQEAKEAMPSFPYLAAATILAAGLIFHWRRWLGRQETAWKITLVAAVALVLWHGACLQMGRINDLLGRQASVRTLAEITQRHDPDRIFIYRARAAGYLFTLNRTCWITRGDADVVVFPTPEAKARFFERPAELTRGLRPGQKVEGITLRHIFASDFDPDRWQVVGRAGSFLLVRAGGD
jgi:4-amino-4-deoxy-L-arabinose transferase-like glycosyltransferase